MTKPNPDTMSEKIDNIEKKLEEVPTKKEMKLENEKLIQRALEKADERYASKETEWLVYAGVALALSYLVKQILLVA